jgi:hypothetical protein
MKELKSLLAVAALVATMASCSPADDRYSGFSNCAYTPTAFANTAYGYIAFASYGQWNIEKSDNSDWCTLKTTSGSGMAYYYMPVFFANNTTGSVRQVSITVRDASSNDAYVTFPIKQYATRGDGSLGTAPLVKGIKGDDGSEIAIEYDENSRPTSIKIAKGEETYRDMPIVWNDTTVTIGNSEVKFGVGYQPGSIRSETDTVGYTNNNEGSDYWTFNFEDHRSNGDYYGHGFLFESNLDKVSDPDTDTRCPDSLRYLHHYADSTVFKDFLQLSYSQTDNRCQSVDANQLLFGAKNCSPYLLLGLYRYARATKILSEAKASDGKYTIETTLNSDKSVNTMTVTDKQGGKVTYTFSY